MSQFGFFFPHFALLLEVLVCDSLCSYILAYFPLVIILFVMLYLLIRIDMTNSEVRFWCSAFQDRDALSMYAFVVVELG